MYSNILNRYHSADSPAHDEEHEQWTRRSFMKALGMGSAGTMLLGGSALSASSISPIGMALNESEGDHILVLIRLAGGNDGLNTIVPLYDFDTYANYRPSIYHRQNSLIKLSDDFAIPNYMQPLETLWGEGMMKVVNGVGYEDQSLSHFTSSDIWAASGINTIYNQGFFGRHFSTTNPDYLFNPPEKPLAVQIGSIGNLIFTKEDEQYAFQVSNPNQLENIAKSGVQFGLEDLDTSCKLGVQQEFLRATSNTTYLYSGVINEAYKSSTTNATYEDSDIARQLSIIARLIKGNLGTKVYMVTLGGFDTHADQIERHSLLMSELSSAVSEFYKDLKQSGHDQNVLGMTISEFGRRVFENGSDGTDHGASSNTLLFGPGLEGNGFIGDHPDLSDLDNNKNLKYNTDFRQLYATVLSQWLCLDTNEVQNSLSGDFENLDLGFSCGTNEEGTGDSEDPVDSEENPDTGVVAEELLDPETFSHRPFYDADKGISIAYNAFESMHLEITLYNLLGQKMATLQSGYIAEGEYVLHFSDVMNMESLSSGQYLYRFTNYEGASSKMILIE